MVETLVVSSSWFNFSGDFSFSFNLLDSDFSLSNWKDFPREDVFLSSILDLRGDMEFASTFTVFTGDKDLSFSSGLLEIVDFSGEFDVAKFSLLSMDLLNFLGDSITFSGIGDLNSFSKTLDFPGVLQTSSKIVNENLYHYQVTL